MTESEAAKIIADINKKLDSYDERVLDIEAEQGGTSFDESNPMNFSDEERLKQRAEELYLMQNPPMAGILRPNTNYHRFRKPHFGSGQWMQGPAAQLSNPSNYVTQEQHEKEVREAPDKYKAFASVAGGLLFPWGKAVKGAKYLPKLYSKLADKFVKSSAVTNKLDKIGNPTFHTMKNLLKTGLGGYGVYKGAEWLDDPEQKHEVEGHKRNLTNREWLKQWELYKMGEDALSYIGLNTKYKKDLESNPGGFVKPQLNTPAVQDNLRIENKIKDLNPREFDITDKEINTYMDTAKVLTRKQLEIRNRQIYLDKIRETMMDSLFRKPGGQ